MGGMKMYLWIRAIKRWRDFGRVARVSRKIKALKLPKPLKYLPSKNSISTLNSIQKNEITYFIKGRRLYQSQNRGWDSFVFQTYEKHKANNSVLALANPAAAINFRRYKTMSDIIQAFGSDSFVNNMSLIKTHASLRQQSTLSSFLPHENTKSLHSLNQQIHAPTVASYEKKLDRIENSITHLKNQDLRNFHINHLEIRVENLDSIHNLIYEITHFTKKRAL